MESEESPPNPSAVLGLPAPAGPRSQVIDLSKGGSFAFEALGPVVVNEDGTMARIANWHSMTAEEQSTTQRVIAARNNVRLARLRAAQATVEPLD
jgi:hypothetical protein